MTYYAPVDLGGIETVPLQATTSQRSQLWDEHIKDLLIHDNNHNMDAGLRTMVLEAVNNTYIFALHKVFMVYMGSSTKYIMNHLMTLYGHITAADIKWRKFLQEPLDMSQLIDVFFNTINDGVQYARKANAQFMSSQFLQMAYHAVRFSVIYLYYCKHWRWKLSAEKI